MSSQTGPMTDLLELRSVEKTYARGQRRVRVLRGVSMTVERGEVVAVVGGRYDGKTTLLKVAAGFEPPDSGEVWFEGQHLSRLSARKRELLRGSDIAWVNREPIALGFQVLDHVALPLRVGRSTTSPVDRAMEALERVGAAHTATCHWEELSNWERVLVALARGIVERPSLMVIDDVLDGHGPSKTQAAGAMLSSLAREFGCGVLMSVSDVEAALDADRIWALSTGQLQLLSGHLGGAGAIIDFPAGGVRSSGA